MGNRKQTELLLLASVGQIIQKQGFAGLKVNDIAQQAGVNKTLIYRYFGSMEGLLEAFADSQDFWPGVAETLGSDPENLLEQAPAKILKTILANHIRALKKRPITIEILAQECVERNRLTAILEDLREKRSMELQQYLLDHLQKQDRTAVEIQGIFAMGAILTGALQYFLIRSRFIKVFGGLDIQSDAGYDNILDIIEEVIT